ncbi:Aldo-keto reductase [Mycena kentingensis (nom. inval.)]|nr:Aldo-keto reductase [Mycena kentingensis (nom. inval.)]
MSPQIPAFRLNDGSQMPSVGLGFVIPDFSDEQVYEMVSKAIKVGYRHFDTATGYGNEVQVGKAIRDSGIPRREFYITTNLANGDHSRVCDAFHESLERLNLEWVDLYLLHWPQAAPGDVDFADINNPGLAFPPTAHPTFIETYLKMQKLLETGLVKAIGVSNFSIKTLGALLEAEECTVTPAVNQVELHPCLPQDDLKAFCEEKGILLTAYSPLGRSKTFFAEHPLISELSEKHEATWAQIILSWGVQRGTAVVPKTEDVGRMVTNITLVKLLGEDMEALNNLHLQPGMHRSLVPFHGDYGGVFGWKYEWLGWSMTKDGFVL